MKRCNRDNCWWIEENTWRGIRDSQRIGLVDDKEQKELFTGITRPKETTIPANIYQRPQDER